MARLHLLHGDDAYGIDEAARSLLDEFRREPNAEFNLSQFDGPETDVGALISAAASMPFMSERRLVIARDLIAHHTRKGAGDTGKRALDQMAAALPDLPETTTLILLEHVKLPETSKLLKAAQAGSVKYFAAAKDSTEWILKQAKARGSAIEPAAARALSSVTGNDLRLADNELAKLIAYVDGARPISEADVSTLTTYVSETRLFDMTDALGAGKGGLAARLAHRLLEQNEDPFSLFAMIVRQFRLLLLVKEHLMTGGSRDGQSIATALGIHRYAADKIAVQSRAFSLDQLERIFRILQDTDVKMKTGGIDPVLALDLLIAQLAR